MKMMAQEWNPFVRLGCISVFNYQKKSADRKVLLDNRLMFVQEGSCRLTTFADESECRLKPGDLFYLPAGTEFSIQAGVDGVSIIIICFDFTQRYNYMEKTLLAVRSEDITAHTILKNDSFEDCEIYNDKMVLFNVPQLKNKMLAIVNEFEEYKIGRGLFREKSAAMLKHLLLSILQDFFHSNERYDERIHKILDFIEQHYPEKISNDDICAAVGYHPYYLNDIVKSQTGRTIHQHLVHKRLSAAKKQLALTQKSIIEIAADSGFLTQTHFSIAFKKSENISPTKYRSLYANKVLDIL